MPPPSSKAEFLLRVLLITRRLAPPLEYPPALATPPPAKPGAWPLVMVRLAMVTVLEGAMWNTRLAALPFTARLAEPGPRIVTLLVTSNSPLVSRMVPVTPDALMVSPLAALARAARSVPAPLSAVLLTVIVICAVARPAGSKQSAAISAG